MSRTTTLDVAPATGPSRSPHRPHERPPLALRVFLGLLGVGALLFNVALMISDRAPRFTRDAFGGVARRLSERLDADRRAELLRDGGLPEGDAIVHIGVWALAALLLMLTIWTWRGILVSAVVVFAVSVVIEFAQGRYSTSREVEASDVVANAVGVLLGAGIAAICLAAWSALAVGLRSVRAPRS